MLGTVEKNTEAAVREIFTGLKTFLRENKTTPIKQITFVVFRQPDVFQSLSRALEAGKN
jgi:hypothetical protein